MRGTRQLTIALGALLGALLAGGAQASAGAQDPPASPPPPRRVRIVRTDSTRDSGFVRVTINTDQIEHMIHDLMASKAMEQTIAMSLREAASGQSSDPRKVRELSEELARIGRKNAALMTTIEISCPGDRQPEGYLGLQFSELQTVMGDDSPQVPPLRNYPRIDSVYANSPASKAGARRGDLVLLISGQDARRAVALDKLLKPATKVPMRVQRDGAQKDFTIVVEKRPADFNSECENVDQVMGPEFDRPMVFMRSPGAGRIAFAPRAGTQPPQPPDTPAPPAPPFVGYDYAYSTMNSAIAGATLMALDDDWRATLGVDNGVLVMKVLPGTPAKDAGLHNGDVITSADGQNVASVRSLARIVSNASSNSVKLQVIRAGKPQTLVLRWQDGPPDKP
jgi:S1-C subfamily serine protease